MSSFLFFFFFFFFLSQSACPVELSVLWTVFNLDLAIQRSQTGSGPNGTCIAEYTFVIDFAKTSTGSPPLKTVRAVISVLGQHYPGRTGHIVLVHGGAMMTWIVRALKPLTPKHMREKVPCTHTCAPLHKSTRHNLLIAYIFLKCCTSPCRACTNLYRQVLKKMTRCTFFVWLLFVNYFLFLVCAS